MVDLGLEARLERRLRELCKEKMRSHERRLAEWRRQQAGRDSQHSELTAAVWHCIDAAFWLFVLRYDLGVDTIILVYGVFVCAFDRTEFNYTRSHPS